jgi:5-methylcytosine-specific restriction endonuclease McrA
MQFSKKLFNDAIEIVKTRDKCLCQICLKPYNQVAHILSKENYPELKENPMNMICLCFYHHKIAPISSHLDGVVFTIWLQKNKPEIYNYIYNFLVLKHII